MKTAIVAGALANKYGNGGAIWTRLSWALGLKRLGFDVWFLEQIESGSCVDRSGRPARFRDSANKAGFEAVTGEFGLPGALILDAGAEIAGAGPEDLGQLALSADLLLNISGNLKLDPFLEGPAVKVYLDLDPGFTQFWLEEGLLDETFSGHDYYYTIGERIGDSRCPIPAGGVPWRVTRQPVILDLWPCTRAADGGRFTTVTGWRDPCGTITREGQCYGLKVHEFRRFIDFPRRVAQRCEIAVDIDPADGEDRDRLIRHGWTVRDPRRVAASPEDFRLYVQNSGAEFSVAKGLYVGTGSGWFSDRTVRYLASGRPALIQDTGTPYPSGEGLLLFADMDQAVAGASSIARHYADHCQAARALAEQFFDSDLVLAQLLEEVGVLP